MFGIRIATLRPDSVPGFDLHLMISGKHLLYLKGTDVLEAERLRRLREKNVSVLFVAEKFRSVYESYVEGFARRALNDTSLPLEQRAEIIGGQSRAAVEDMFGIPVSPRNYERARTAAMNQVAFLLQNPDAVAPLLALAKVNPDVYQHSVNVATIAVALAASLGAQPDACDVLGLGCLLHDIGKSDEGEAAAMGPKHHPRAGAGLLLGRKYVSQAVLDVILLHEARIDGKGVPEGLKTLDQIYQVASLANMYDRGVTLEGRKPAEVYNTIAELDPPPYDPRLIEGLKDVIDWPREPKSSR